MTVEIDQMIVDQRVLTGEEEEGPSPEPVETTGPIERPESLQGKTYKIRPGSGAAAMYITINYTWYNDRWRPLEIFINSKDVSHFSWVVALTRMISGIFRSGGDYLFILDELKTVSDPSGPYIVPGEGFVKSLPAHLGMTIEQSFKEFGVLGSDESRADDGLTVSSSASTEHKDYGYTGVTCPSCQLPTLKVEGGCEECLNSDCEYSGCD